MKKIIVFTLLFISFMGAQISHASSKPLLPKKKSKFSLSCILPSCCITNQPEEYNPEEYNEEAASVQKDDKERADNKDNDKVTILFQIPNTKWNVGVYIQVSETATLQEALQIAFKSRNGAYFVARPASFHFVNRDNKQLYIIIDTQDKLKISLKSLNIRGSEFRFK
jgi:hypothetical protein